MATVYHSALTDSLHEPKGITSALEDQIYIADGAGSGNWTDAADILGYSYIDIEITTKETETVALTADTWTPFALDYTDNVSNNFTHDNSEILAYHNIKYTGTNTIIAQIVFGATLQWDGGGSAPNIYGKFQTSTDTTTWTDITGTAFARYLADAQLGYIGSSGVIELDQDTYIRPVVMLDQSETLIIYNISYNVQGHRKYT